MNACSCLFSFLLSLTDLSLLFLLHGASQHQHLCTYVSTMGCHNELQNHAVPARSLKNSGWSTDYNQRGTWNQSKFKKKIALPNFLGDCTLYSCGICYWVMLCSGFKWVKPWRKLCLYWNSYSNFFTLFVIIFFKIYGTNCLGCSQWHLHLMNKNVCLLMHIFSAVAFQVFRSSDW